MRFRGVTALVWQFIRAQLRRGVRSGAVTGPSPTWREAPEARSRAESLEDGSLDPDELDGEPAWWDEGSDDET